ncbi:TolC family protein [uncultured Psychroserpens sp.]|uniref:TolC family protein n=1 Tax=uncultured Psychroserpens sp. TaxID=255436 RepID=UPI0026018CE9|nr:TolC family protein [uncultured Psychroserpens sp.]
MKYIIYIHTLLAILVSCDAIGQELVPITRSEVKTIVAERNTNIKISDEAYNSARADFLQTDAIFLPNITASHTGISTTNPLVAFGSKLNQEVLTQSDFNPALLNDPSVVQNFATKLEIQQPILNMDGIYQRKAARSIMQAMSLKAQRTVDYLEFEVDNAYMQLQLAYKGVDVLEKALNAAKANLKLAENRFTQGYIQRADVLNVEIRVTEVENQLQMANSQVKNASDYLSFLMNDKSFVVYQPVDSLEVNVVSDASVSISENRADIRAMSLTTEAYKATSKANKMAFLPRLNAFGSYEFYDEQLFQANANGYVIGAQLSWDIFQGSKRFGKVQKSKAEYEKSKLEYDQYVSQSQLELNKAQRMFIDAENRLKLTSLALQQSKESLRIRTNRFKEGLEKTSDLLIAESQYAQKELEYYQTIFEYNYAQAYLEFLTKE